MAVKHQNITNPFSSCSSTYLLEKVQSMKLKDEKNINKKCTSVSKNKIH